MIVDNLGLARSDREIVGGAIATVARKQSKHKGPGGFNLSGEGIIREDVALQKVIQTENWCWCDGDRRWNQVVLDSIVIAFIGEVAADGIVGWLDRRRLVIGKDSEYGRAGLAAIKEAGAGDVAAKARQNWGADSESVVNKLTIFVVDV